MYFNANVSYRKVQGYFPWHRCNILIDDLSLLRCYGDREEFCPSRRYNASQRRKCDRRAPDNRSPTHFQSLVNMFLLCDCLLVVSHHQSWRAHEDFSRNAFVAWLPAKKLLRNYSQSIFFNIILWLIIGTYKRISLENLEYNQSAQDTGKRKVAHAVKMKVKWKWNEIQ